LKVHREREEDDRLLGKEEEEREDGEGEGRGRKRRRSFVVGDGEEEGEGGKGGEPSRKVRRRSVSVAGKDWVCEQGGCGKGFKSVSFDASFFAFSLPSLLSFTLLLCSLLVHGFPSHPN